MKNCSSGSGVATRLSASASIFVSRPGKAQLQHQQHFCVEFDGPELMLGATMCEFIPVLKIGELQEWRDHEIHQEIESNAHLYLLPFSSVEGLIVCDPVLTPTSVGAFDRVN
ncbi:hypothetical protein Mapa_004248 [Marchantia paleacea]|nr:hypothetical protein Mapa_004248 [Marchantia paleacea]